MLALFIYFAYLATPEWMFHRPTINHHRGNIQNVRTCEIIPGKSEKFLFIDMTNNKIKCD